MLEEIQEQGGVAKIGEFISKVKDKNSNVKLMGFGHRVYKNYDPRAKLMRETCYEVLEDAGPARRSACSSWRWRWRRSRWKTSTSSSASSTRTSTSTRASCSSAIGIPVALFTAIFALARTVGWIAQWNEMISDPEQKIGRPRQLYRGFPAPQRPEMAKR